MIRSQCLLLKPTYKQAGLFARSAGLSRFAWNWALALSQRYYRMFGQLDGYKSLSKMSLVKHWNKIKHRRGSLSWVNDYSKLIPEDAFKRLENAYKRAFKNIKSGKKGKAIGWPKFKKRRHGVGSFEVLPSGSFKLAVKNNRIRIPRVGMVKVVSKFRWPESKQVYGRVSLKCGKWYLTLAYELCQKETLPADRPKCGIDLGCKTFATVVSNGECVEEIPPLKPYAKAKRRLQRAGRIVSRRVKGSGRRKRAIDRLARHHKRVADLRSDFLHKITSRLTKRFGVIVLEDLNVKGLAGGMLAGTIADLGFGEFRRQIEYKSEATGTKIVFADRFYPSSKTCFKCGAIKDDLKLSDRVFECSCGYRADRDVNAARNLETIPVTYGESTHVESGSSSSRKGRGAARRNVKHACSSQQDE